MVSEEFITEAIKYFALKYLSFSSTKFIPSFLQYVLSTYHVPGMLVGLGEKATNKIDMVTALMVFTVQGVQWG